MFKITRATLTFYLKKSYFSLTLRKPRHDFFFSNSYVLVYGHQC